MSISRKNGRNDMGEKFELSENEKKEIDALFIQYQKDKNKNQLLRELAKYARPAMALGHYM